MATIKLTKDNFKTEAMAEDTTMLIDFWAPWCGPCRMLSPIVDEIAGELAGKAKVAKVNVDEEKELAAQFRVMGIPTLAVLKGGELAAMSVGVRSKQEILEMLEQ
ncbi:MAG: thioredoxin [Christensenellales bacterium]